MVSAATAQALFDDGYTDLFLLRQVDFHGVPDLREQNLLFSDHLLSCIFEWDWLELIRARSFMIFKGSDFPEDFPSGKLFETTSFCCPNTSLH